MDKIYGSPWFAKAISFLIAIMLFIIVNYDNASNQSSILPIITNGSYTLEEVELNVQYNEEKYAITEIIDHVQVVLRGPQNVLTLFQISRPSYDVYVDLLELEAGTHYVNVQHKNFPNELSVRITPQTVRVTIEEKRTISIPVEIDILNKSAIKEGYTLGTPIVNPVNVEITAAESVIQQVGFAKGFVDVQELSETSEKNVPIKVYDQQGNELHIDVNPTVVEVKVPITSPSKDVPVKINRVGELPEGLSIKTIYTEPKELTIYGLKTIIDKINLIEGLEVDLTSISQSTVIELEVPVPEGVEKITPASVKVIIEIDIEETVELSDIPVDISGLAEGVEASFSSLEQQKMTIIARGSPAAIQRLKNEDVKIYLDVNELPIGEHFVPVQVIGPQNIRFNKPLNEIKIIITEVLSTEEDDNNETDNEEA